MDTFTYFDTVADHWMRIVMYVLALLGLIAVAYIAIQIMNRQKLKHRTMTWLEITPPASIAKTPEATEHLFSVIHGSRAARQPKDKLLGRSPVMSFEIVSTKKEGIRYLVQVESSQSKNLQKSITSYVPSSKVREVNAPEHANASVVEFKQAKHYVLPVVTMLRIEQHDPMAYITGAMTKLEDGEQITLQLVLTPVNLPEARQLSKRILGNEDVLRRVQGGKMPFMGKFMEWLGSMAMGTAELTGEFYSGTTYGHKQNKSLGKDAQFQSQVLSRQRPARTLSAFELELMDSMHQKLTKPLFHVNLRVMVTSNSAKDHIASLRSAIDGYSVPPYQELRAKMRLPVLNKYRVLLAEKRLPSFTRKQGIILSAAEVASLYHFPSSHISKTDNLITSLSRTLPAPVSLKSGKRLAVTFGENHHHGSVTLIGLTKAERERHMYVIGGTGNGKTTMLLSGIVQDIQNGRGVAVIDPHGDLAETILKHIPEDRITDVIYMNPDDLSYPIGMNLLELPVGLEGDDLLREKDLITEATISVMRKIFSDDDSGGHRIEYILRNATQTALTLEAPTLFTIFELLNNAKYRRAIVHQLTDENLKNFWKNELGKAGDFQRVKMSAGITAKIGRFLFSASAKRILEQEKSTIDFETILDEGKILICNFSKGLLGEDTASLFGTTVLAKLQMASLRRARVSSVERRSFYLYVDEFQNFATMSFVQMLSEARKYKLFLIMAEQSTSQQDEQRLVEIILANVGTVVCFRSGSPADEKHMLPLFSPYIEQGEIANLPAFSFYARLAALHSQEPISGMTIILSDSGSTLIAHRVIASSRRLYALHTTNGQIMSPQPVRKEPIAVKRRSVQPNTSLSDAAYVE